ncbi:hydroxyacid dehydrogenase [Aquincola sp. S2]|uniref:Hydroxyacid dehydrogenase n=1 Tax=Pseudaquabacterium terrae TaxID=2732868 RepID=A0ABX2EM98_9BURK|nr:NAD(P)-dependent oxidoreductase [Aquabacterium terrae]NRF69718.1 hydroxyacid dehydrogenase [Aquabacterium terrae]
MTRVLLTHAATARAHYFGPRALAALERLAQVRLNPHDRPLSTAELIDAARGCRYVIADRATEGRAELFDGCPDLQAFVRCAVDIRTVDVAAASRAGVLVTQASAGYVAAVAEWVMGVSIDLARGIGDANARYHAGAPPAPRMGREMRGAILGLVGYGQIARYLSGLAQAFGMQVLVHDPHAPRDADAPPARSLPQLLAESDIVVCLAAATAETEGLFDAAAFAAMKPDACFVNAARGELVDEAALLAALNAGRLAGCALDVGRAADQRPSDALARHPRVIATPHIGGLTLPAVEHQAFETVEQVGALLRGELPRGAVNAAHAARLGSDSGSPG